MKSHMMIVKTLSEHIIMVILHFWAKKKNSSLKTTGLSHKQV